MFRTSSTSKRPCCWRTCLLLDHKPEAALKALEPWRGDAHQNGRLRSGKSCVQALAHADLENAARA
jgi:hypothetical protein